jgi:hypothetical protein
LLPVGGGGNDRFRLLISTAIFKIPGGSEALPFLKSRVTSIATTFKIPC